MENALPVYFWYRNALEPERHVRAGRLGRQASNDGEDCSPESARNVQIFASTDIHRMSLFLIVKLK